MTVLINQTLPVFLAQTLGIHIRIGGPKNASRGRKVAGKTDTRDEKPNEQRGKRELKARRVVRKTDFFSNILYQLEPCT